MRLTVLAGLILASVAISGCGGGGSGGNGGSGGPAQRSIELPANDLVYDKVSKRIYASIPSSAGMAVGNTIAVINPVSGSVEKHIPVGNEPNRLAVSTDGQFLYVALDSAASISRVPLATGSQDLQFSLPSDGYPRVTEMAVLPGHPHSLVVAMSGIGPTWGLRIAVFDDGTQRPNAFQSPPLNELHQSMTCSDNGATVFAYRRDSQAARLIRLSVTDQGLTETEAATGVLTFWDGGLQLHAGRIFSSAGHIIDANTLAPLGTLPVLPTLIVENRYTVDEQNHSARYFYGGGGTVPAVIIQNFNTDRYVMTNEWTLQLPDLGPTSSLFLSRPATWGPGTAAISVVNSPFDNDPAKFKHRILLLSNLPQ